MFEVTADDIALLGEEDLRSLIGLLCEAEVRSRALSTVAVSWGGHQNAADAGLDVRVTLRSGTRIDGFVPRFDTGFQVKKPDLPPAKILREMRPGGKLRSIIQELASKSGAYVIVSSTASTSELSLTKRRNAMRNAVGNEKNAQSLHLDFYDRSRVATWVRNHIGLVTWVRERIAKSVTGWRPYGAWAYSPDGNSGEYLLDDRVRIHAAGSETGLRLQPIEGMDRIRTSLRMEGGVVRLVGLSGVGKTRLAQALFDERIGTQGLDPSLAIYTNMGDGPNPHPIALSSELVALRTRAILVIDNCPPDLHARLSELCRSAESKLSVLTIEYDIHDDQPEGTEVFELRPSSPELIERLIKQRFASLPSISSHTIAHLSDGNARIAISLAGAVKRGETITPLADQELFERLFQQRQRDDKDLLLAAQACSLVYSFDGVDVSKGGELSILGSMIERTPHEMFRAVAELIRRDLVQQRSFWRAVLPHALANRLGATALQNIPASVIEEKLVTGASERLLKSFAHRLGYLSGSPEARSIVTRWLADGGLLGNLSSLDESKKTMFENVAPVVPESTLAVIERAAPDPTGHYDSSLSPRCVYILRSLAYDPALFDRSVELLIRLTVNDSHNNSNVASNAFASLFALYLSGTWSPIEQRLQIIQSLLVSTDSRRRDLGLMSLKCALEAWHFSSFHTFEFGARSRDFGYLPKSSEEIKHWYRSVLDLCEKLHDTRCVSTPSIRGAVAEKLRGLWTKAKVYAEIEHLADVFGRSGFWPEGWIAIRTIQRWDASSFDKKTLARLTFLERALRPRNLIERVRSIVLSSRRGSYLDLDLGDEIAGDITRRLERLESLAFELGKAVAVDQAVLTQLLPDLLIGSGRLWSFGRGLMEGAESIQVLWDLIVAELGVLEKTPTSVQLLCGFITALRRKDSRSCDAILDKAVTNSTLGIWYPTLQSCAGLDERGIVRLLESLKIAIAPAHSYRSLSWANIPKAGNGFATLVEEIATRPDGFEVAVEMVEMQLHSEENAKQKYSPEVLSAGRDLFRQFQFTHENSSHQDWSLSYIAERCLEGQDNATIVGDFCKKLRDAIATYRTHPYWYTDLLAALIRVHPMASLNGLFTDVHKAEESGFKVLSHFDFHRYNPFDILHKETILSWCDQQPFVRYPLMAAAITPFRASDDSAPRQWKPVALTMLDRAPEPGEVLKEFVMQFSPMSWTGSRLPIIELNTRLLDDLDDHPNPQVRTLAQREKQRLKTAIQHEKLVELEWSRQQDERFE